MLTSKKDLEKSLKAQTLDLFKHRCYICGKRTNVVHEIKPRGRGIESLSIDNMVAICFHHHDARHSVGITDEEVKKQQELREARLNNLYGKRRPFYPLHDRL